MSIKKKVPTLRFKRFSEIWNTSKLKEITSYVDYRGRAPIKSESGHFLVTAKNIKQGFIDYECSKEYVATKDYSNVMSKGMPKIGDVLFTTEAPMGNVAQIDNPNIALAQRVIKFRGKQSLKNSFLLYYMLSKPFKQYTSKKAIGSTVKGISGKELHKTPVSFPEIEEQQKIASFLSSVDKKIALLQQKKTLLEHYKKGVMQQIFSQQLRFKDDDGNDFADWEKKKLGDIATKESSNISANKIEENIGDYKIYGASGLLKNIDFYREENPYISIVKDGAGVGRTLLCDAKSSVLGTLDIIKPRINANLYFIYSLLNNIDFTKYITGSTIPHIYFKDYSKEKIKIPSIKEQTKIANFLSAIDDKIQLVAESIEATQQFKKGLLQQMFV